MLVRIHSWLNPHKSNSRHMTLRTSHALFLNGSACIPDGQDAQDKLFKAIAEEFANRRIMSISVLGSRVFSLFFEIDAPKAGDDDNQPFTFTTEQQLDIARCLQRTLCSYFKPPHMLYVSTKHVLQLSDLNSSTQSTSNGSGMHLVCSDLCDLQQI